MFLKVILVGGKLTEMFWRAILVEAESTEMFLKLLGIQGETSKLYTEHGVRVHSQFRVSSLESVERSTNGTGRNG